MIFEFVVPFAVDVVRVAISAFKSPKRDSEVEHATPAEPEYIKEGVGRVGGRETVRSPELAPDLLHMRNSGTKTKRKAIPVTSHFKLVFLTVAATTVGAGGLHPENSAEMR
jgi:hypothetical protein